MSVVLRADSIGKAFGGRRVLTSAYFEVAAGRLTALVGRNGAGKSTLLKIAAGWVAPDHGFVELRGTRHMRPRAAELARQGLLYLPVDRSILSPVFTLGQHMDAMVRRFGAAALAVPPRLPRQVSLNWAGRGFCTLRGSNNFLITRPGGGATNGREG